MSQNQNTRQITTRVTPDLREELDRVAAESDLNREQLLRRFIRQGLAKAIAEGGVK